MTRMRRMRRWLGLILASVAIVYLLGCAAVYSIQDSLVFPGHRLQHTTEAASNLHAGTSRVTFQAADGTAIVGRLSLAPDAKSSTPTVVFFYGNAMCAAWTHDFAQTLNSVGCNVLVPDYIGFGESDGKPSEANCYATADAAIAYLASRGDIDMDRIIVMGQSLGSGVAIDYASRNRVAGVITLAAYTSVTAVGQDAYPFLPIRVLSRSRFDSVRKAGQVEAPVLMFHGRRDSLIKPSHATRLQQALGAKATLVWVERADHDTVFVADPTLVDGSLRRFLKRVEAEARPD